MDISIYRKSTHTDRYLDFNSHHEYKEKVSAANTLLHRALNLPSSESGKALETNRISSTLRSNGYPKKTISEIINKKLATNAAPNHIPTPEDLVRMFFRWADPENNNNFVVLPYIKGTTEPVLRILKQHDISVSTKPLSTLQSHFQVPKFRPNPEQQCNVVYRIPCADCPWSYIGETKRSFETRKKEHIRNVKNFNSGSNVAKHAWTHNHAIDFKNAKVIDKANNHTRKFLESWHTAKTAHADNNSFNLPGQYKILLDKH